MYNTMAVTCNPLVDKANYILYSKIKMSLLQIYIPRLKDLKWQWFSAVLEYFTHLRENILNVYQMTCESRGHSYLKTYSRWQEIIAIQWEFHQQRETVYIMVCISEGINWHKE